MKLKTGYKQTEVLAKDPKLHHRKGFSRSNLIRIRQFYLGYPKGATLSHLLDWSRIVPDREALRHELEMTLREAEQ